MATLFFWRFDIFTFPNMFKHLLLTCQIHVLKYSWDFCVRFPGFVESSPYVEKIKVFEQYFTSQIDLYDKVSEFIAWFFPNSLILILHLIVFFSPFRMRLKGKAAFWWTTKTLCLTSWFHTLYLILPKILKRCLRRYWTAWVSQFIRWGLCHAFNKCKRIVKCNDKGFSVELVMN